MQNEKPTVPDSRCETGRVLVLDSGVGGLSICRSLLKTCPHISIQYLADDECFPYGTKDNEFLVARLSELISRCHERFQFDLVILACNTISTLLLPHLREQFDVPFVGVVPAIKPAAALSKTKHIGLLATLGTVSRPYTDELVRDFAEDCSVLKVGSNELVQQAEILLNDGVADEFVIEEALRPFGSAAEHIDTIVLGCTHFPLLHEYFSKLMPDVHFVDSGEAIARRVCFLIACGESFNSGRSASEGRKRDEDDSAAEMRHTLMFTRKVPHTEQFFKSIEGLGFKSVVLDLFK